MEYLPWLWNYGNFVWASMLLAAVGVGLLRAYRAPTRWGKQHWRRSFERLLRQSSASGGERALRPVRTAAGLADGAVQVVAGTVRIGTQGRGCASYDSGAEVAASTAECWLPAAVHGSMERPITLRRRADKLMLALDGGEVELDGEVEVWVGTTEYQPRGRLCSLPRAVFERMFRDRPPEVMPLDLLKAPPMIHSLADGDTIVVLGRVSTALGAAVTAETGMHPYRASAPERWTMRPCDTPEGRGTGTGKPALVALSVAAPVIPMPGPRRFVTFPAVWLGTCLALLAALGAGMMDIAQHSELSVSPETGDLMLRNDALPLAAPALSLAAAMPFHRGEALDTLAEVLTHSRYRTGAVVQARVAVDRLRGACMSAALLLWQHQQPEAAIEHVERCELRRGDADMARNIAGLAWMDLGEYERASAAFAAIEGFDRAFDGGTADNQDPWLHELVRHVPAHATAHVLARNWPMAARSLSLMTELPDTSARDLIPYRCLAAAAAAKGGDLDARHMLERQAAIGHDPVCALAAMNLASGDDKARKALERRAISWEGLRGTARGRHLMYLNELLSREHSGASGTLAQRDPDEARVLSMALSGYDTPFDSLPALETAVLDRLAAQTSLARHERLMRLALAARGAALAAHLGQHQRAKELRDLAVADAQAFVADASARSVATRLVALSNTLLLSATIHWRAGELDAAFRALAHAQTHAPKELFARVESALFFERDGRVLPALGKVLAGGFATDMDMLADIAAHGDGAALADLIARGEVAPNAAGLLAPRIVSGREQLLDVLVWSERAPEERTVAEQLWHDGARAFAAERLQAPEVAEAVLAAAVRRQRALGERDSAVLAYLLGVLRAHAAEPGEVAMR